MNDFDWQNFELQEALFTKLFFAVTGILSDWSLYRIYRSVYVGEPKLAIDMLVAAFTGENKFATPEIISLVHDLALTIKKDPKIYAKKLRIECRKNEEGDQRDIDFKQVESLFRKLLPALEKIFSEFKISLIQLYLDAGRYEFALSIISTFFIEKKFKKETSVTPEVVLIIYHLAISMKSNPEIYLVQLDIEENPLTKEKIVFIDW